MSVVTATEPLTAQQLVIVIPARNEAASIREVVTACLLQASRVIVIDDASSDGTAAALNDLPVQVLRAEQQLGKGGALAWGFRVALEQGARAVMTLDGDGQHDAADIPAFVQAANRYPGQLIIGARLKQQQCAPRNRKMANCIADFWVSWAAGVPVRDSQCGQRLYPRELLTAVKVNTALANSFVFESEIVVESVRKGFAVVAVPIAARYPPQARASYFKPVRDVLAITRMISTKMWRSRFSLRDLRRVLSEQPRIVERIDL